MKFLVVCILLLIGIVALSVQHSEGFFDTPSAVPSRVVVTACLSENLVILKARTTDNTTIQNVYVVNHSSHNVVAPEEFTDQIHASQATITPTESIIELLPSSSMVVGKTYYVIREITPSDPNAKKYQGNQPTVTSRNELLGVFTYATPSACPPAPAAPVAPAPAAAPPARSMAPAPVPAPVPRPIAPTSAPVPALAAPAALAPLQARTFDRQEPSSAAISGTSKEAQSLKQRMDILSDVQTLLKKKTLEKRRLPPAKSECDDDCEDDCEHNHANHGNHQGNKDASAALSQGQEYQKACDHDMTQYIRKDSIPCWKCNLDY